MAEFRTWLEERVREAGGKPSVVARRIGIAPNYITNWRSGKGITQHHMEQALAAYGLKTQLVETAPAGPGHPPLMTGPSMDPVDMVRGMKETIMRQGARIIELEQDNARMAEALSRVHDATAPIIAKTQPKPPKRL